MGEKQEAGEAFKQKANEYSNWFTAIIISTFVFLIDPKNQSGVIWAAALALSFISLVAIFLFKFLGVFAAYLRICPKFCLRCEESFIEKVREQIILCFVIASLISVICAFVLLWNGMSH